MKATLTYEFDPTDPVEVWEAMLHSRGKDYWLALWKVREVAKDSELGPAIEEIIESLSLEMEEPG